MSTFGGLVDEINHISIDRFDGLNLRSKVFFLSHCHTDHMVGLMDAVDGLPGTLYLSALSSVIIRRKFPQIDNIKCLQIGDPTIVPIFVEDDDEGNKRSSIVVTAIPAGHCPGSVMFLFEKENLRILYTGDFRLKLINLQSISALKNSKGDNILIDAAYIDSTFLSKKYRMFPSQIESIEVIIDLIDKWLQSCEHNIVVIRPPALYGYECLFAQIAERLKQKIHMNQNSFEYYQYIPEFDQCFSKDSPASHRIHVCPPEESVMFGGWKCKSLSCTPTVDSKNVCIIRPTAWKWEKLGSSTPIFSMEENTENVYFVCYSNHSSYEEIYDMLLYLKPNSVRLNVLPSALEARRDMDACLKGIMDNYLDSCKDEDQARKYDTETITFQNIRINRSEDIIKDNEFVGDKDLVISHHVLKRRKKR